MCDVSNLDRRSQMRTALFVAVALATAQLEGSQRFTSRTNIVSVYATVQDSIGRLEPDLTASDFEILDNGKPVRISLFANTPQPFATVLLLDMSRSMARQYRALIEAASAFVNSISAEDRVRIGSFGREVFVHPLLTGDKGRLIQILQSEMWPGGATPLWRAATLAMNSLDAEHTRRVVLVVTDGNDSGRDYNCAPLVSDVTGLVGPCPTQRDVRNQAEVGEDMFYLIGLEQTGLDAGIKDVADRTGGGYFELKPGTDLKRTFERVVEELHHQYLLGFEPTALDGRVHELRIRTTRNGMVVRARRTYVAGAAK